MELIWECRGAVVPDDLEVFLWFHLIRFYREYQNLFDQRVRWENLLENRYIVEATILKCWTRKELSDMRFIRFDT